MGFAVPLRVMSGAGESRVRLTGRLGDGDFCLGGGELSSPEDSSPPASARSSASKSAMVNRLTSVQSSEVCVGLVRLSLSLIRTGIRLQFEQALYFERVNSR
jgi:hypothetical protein